MVLKACIRPVYIMLPGIAIMYLHMVEALMVDTAVPLKPQSLPHWDRGMLAGKAISDCAACLAGEGTQPGPRRMC